MRRKQRKRIRSTTPKVSREPGAVRRMAARDHGQCRRDSAHLFRNWKFRVTSKLAGQERFGLDGCSRKHEGAVTAVSSVRKG